ncbi:hypothetical protein [Mitsuokella multacida]|nr:hypothetical protein [Mitsuokella multacida]
MMTTKNILVGIGAAILLVLPTFVNIASAGTEASVSEQQVLTDPYAGNCSYADDTLAPDYMLEVRGVDR